MVASSGGCLAPSSSALLVLVSKRKFSASVTESLSPDPPLAAQAMTSLTQQEIHHLGGEGTLDWWDCVQTNVITGLGLPVTTCAVAVKKPVCTEWQKSG